jgi:hypothetical protein
VLIIAHRGNLSGPSPTENCPIQIDTAIQQNFECEIDLWVIGHKLYLGHDFGKYEVSLDWIVERKDKLWIHCKNSSCLKLVLSLDRLGLNFFWHQKDDYALTSKNNIWVYPGQKLLEGSIAVLPENFIEGENMQLLSICSAICTDFAYEYKRKYSGGLR